MDSEKIGKKIKDIRINNNLTQNEFASSLNVTFQAVSKWERGLSIPDIQTLTLISKIYNVSINEILGDEPDNNIEKEIVKANNNIILKLIIPIFIILLIAVISIVFFVKSNNNFSFKKIDSLCEDYKISGSIAYNKDKAYIYISNIEYCGSEELILKDIDCSLYSTYKDTENKLSTVKQVNQESLKELLKNINFQVDSNIIDCNKLSESKLLIRINANYIDGSSFTHDIKLNMSDTCSN